MANCMNTSNFFWKIENFCSTNKKVSPVFLSLGLKWQLRFSRIKNNDTQQFFLFLYCLNSPDVPSFSEFKVTVCFARDDVTCIIMQMETYNLNDGEWYVWTNCISDIYDQCGEIKDITFYVRITPADLSTFFKNKKNVEIPTVSDCMNSLIEDLEKLFKNDECSDFVLKCGEKSFPVHKAVLSVRSHFFQGMFRSNMKETKEGSAKIEDVEPDILEIVLRYIYTGQIRELSKKTLQKVYAAADRLGMESLKVKCCSLLVDNFVACSKKDCDGNSKKETSNVNEKTKVVNAESQISKKNKLLKELLISREWRAFSLEFPNKAQEFCKPFLLKNQ